jgi:hypothetical protein
MPKRAKRPTQDNSSPPAVGGRSSEDAASRSTYERPAATAWRRALLVVAAGAFIAWLAFLIVLAVQG